MFLIESLALPYRSHDTLMSWQLIMRTEKVVKCSEVLQLRGARLRRSLSFVIGVPLKPALGGVVNVAHFVTGYEQTQI